LRRRRDGEGGHHGDVAQHVRERAARALAPAVRRNGGPDVANAERRRLSGVEDEVLGGLGGRLDLIRATPHRELLSCLRVLHWQARGEGRRGLSRKAMANTREEGEVGAMWVDGRRRRRRNGGGARAPSPDGQPQPSLPTYKLWTKPIYPLAHSPLFRP
jgi:hypothetical protein